MHTPGPQDAGISNEARTQGMNPQPTMTTTEITERGLKQVGTHSVHSTMETTTTRSFDKRTQQFRYYERTYVFATGRVTMKEVTPPPQEPTPVPEPVPEPVPQAPESVTSETHSENETVISDIYSTVSCPSELRKLCYACSQDVRTYRLVVTGLANGRNLIRNAHEGPCLHCATIKDMVDDKIAARTPRGKKPPPVPEYIVNYPGPRPYPGFTPEELEEYLDKEYPDEHDHVERHNALQDATYIRTGGRNKGRTQGEIWVHIEGWKPPPTPEQVQAAKDWITDQALIRAGLPTLEEQRLLAQKERLETRLYRAEKRMELISDNLYRYGTWLPQDEYDSAYLEREAADKALQEFLQQ